MEAEHTDYGKDRMSRTGQMAGGGIATNAVNASPQKDSPLRAIARQANEHRLKLSEINAGLRELVDNLEGNGPRPETPSPTVGPVSPPGLARINFDLEECREELSILVNQLRNLKSLVDI